MKKIDSFLHRQGYLIERIWILFSIIKIFTRFTTLFCGIGNCMLKIFWTRNKDMNLNILPYFFFPTFCLKLLLMTRLLPSRYPPFFCFIIFLLVLIVVCLYPPSLALSCLLFFILWSVSPFSCIINLLSVLVFFSLPLFTCLPFLVFFFGLYNLHLF